MCLPLGGPSHSLYPTPNRVVTHPTKVPIDPALVTPLPDNDDDCPPPHKILPIIARATSKITGDRRPAGDPKGKGKQGATSAAPVKSAKKKASMALGPLDVKKQRGRVPGAPNYTTEDIDALLDILEVQLPLGTKGWNSAADEFCEWAEENEHSPRTAKSLKLKFEQVFNCSLNFHWTLTCRN
jgi:hypothetical protein